LFEDIVNLLEYLFRILETLLSNCLRILETLWCTKLLEYTENLKYFWRISGACGAVAGGYWEAPKVFSRVYWKPCGEVAGEF
jgi:hypothetical protein